MAALFPIILIATQIVLVADSVPKFDVERTCRAAAVSGVPGRDSTSCQRDEQDARSTLQQDWTQYSSIQRSRCTGLVATGGPPSYVELLTCLEMARDVRNMHTDGEGKAKGKTAAPAPVPTTAPPGAAGPPTVIRPK